MKPTLALNIQTVLHDLDSEIPYSKEAFELLCGTCAQESAFGKYRRQLGGGPALGIFQMEPATFNDCINNYLVYRPDLYNLIGELSGIPEVELEPKHLETNDILATCMCRVKYLRAKGSIPKDLQGQAEYWKLNYNSYKGKGKVEDYIANYKRYVEGN